mmetsp:Transcript_25490/g.79286  ORF Transcript_25490/g.79286 Transcript_25490/m.79286 type:complete len:189 (+) Transcript_25490:78-644(+)
MAEAEPPEAVANPAEADKAGGGGAAPLGHGICCLKAGGAVCFDAVVMAGHGKRGLSPAPCSASRKGPVDDERSGGGVAGIAAVEHLGADAAAGVGTRTLASRLPCMMEQASPSVTAAAPAAKRARFGPLAAAAAAQWQLDGSAVEAWAQRRGLPGIGIADIVDYRREHPEEDLAAELAECDLSVREED